MATVFLLANAMGCVCSLGRVDECKVSPTKSMSYGECHVFHNASKINELPRVRQHTLIIEAAEEADYFGFYSPDLEGFSGIKHSIEDCLYKAKWGMKEHIKLLKKQGFPVPSVNLDPKIIVQNERKVVVG